MIKFCKKKSLKNIKRLPSFLDLVYPKKYVMQIDTLDQILSSKISSTQPEKIPTFYQINNNLLPLIFEFIYFRENTLLYNQIIYQIIYRATF